MGVQFTALVLAHLVAVAGGVIAIRRLPQTPSAAWPMALVAILAAAVAAFVFAISDPHGVYMFRDIDRAYYAAGAAVLESPAALAKIMGDGVSGFVNLPVVAYLFAPFALLDSVAAVVIFSALGIAAVLWAWVLLVRVARLEGNERWLLAFLFAANGPLMYSFKLGNTSHIIVLALVGGLALLKRERDVAAGVLLAVAALVKLPLMLFGVYFVLRRNWSAAFAFAGVCGAAALLSVAIFGWELHQRWLELCVLQFSASPVGAWNVQSVPAFLDRLVSPPDVLLDWTAQPAGLARRLAGTAVIAALFAAALYACTRAGASGRTEDRSKGAALDLEYLIVLALAVVASPLSWTHYFVWLLLPAAFFLVRQAPVPWGGVEQGLGWLGLLLVSAIAVRIPFAGEPLLSLYAKAGVSSVLAGGLIWLALLLRARARLGSAASSLAASPASLSLASRAGTQP